MPGIYVHNIHVIEVYIDRPLCSRKAGRNEGPQHAIRPQKPAAETAWSCSRHLHGSLGAAELIVHAFPRTRPVDISFDRNEIARL